MLFLLEALRPRLFVDACFPNVPIVRMLVGEYAVCFREKRLLQRKIGVIMKRKERVGKGG